MPTIYVFSQDCLDMIFWIFSSDNYLVTVPFCVSVVSCCFLLVLRLIGFGR